MTNYQKTDFDWPISGLSDDNAPNSNHIIPFIDITENDADTDNSPELIGLTNDDNLDFSSITPVIDLTLEYQFLNNGIPAIDLANDNVQDINYQIPSIDLTNDNGSSRKQTIQCFDLTEDEYSSHIKEFNVFANEDQDFVFNTPVDLSLDDPFLNCSIPNNDAENDDVQYITHQLQNIDLAFGIKQNANYNISTIDLTREYQFLNNRIPAIDLTNDNVLDINNHLPSIDLTNDNGSSRKQTIQCFDLTKDENSSHSKEFNVLSNEDQDFVFNTPVDLSLDDQFLNSSTPNIDAENDVQYINRQLQNLDFAYGKKQNVNDNILTIDLTSDNDQSVDRFCYDDCDKGRRPVFDLIRNNENVFRKPSDVETYSVEAMSSSNLPNSSQKTDSENNLRTPLVNHHHDLIENNVLKCNDTSSMDLMHTGNFNRFENCHHSKEGILTNLPLTNNFENDLNPKRSDKIFQNTASDFMKPAHRPIPFRHSLGRSTVNSSTNVPIELTESSEDQSRTLTVSSLIRRKKLKPSRENPKNSLPIPSEDSNSRKNAFHFDTFKEIFIRIWIFFIHWISKMIRHV